MAHRRAVLALALAALALAACEDARPPASHTAVLGGSQAQPRAAPAATLTDARGRAIPPPQLPANTVADLVRSGEENALGVWVQDGRAVAASYAPATGWSAARPLEDIYGEASEPRIAADAAGSAMAVWRHTVGSIQSLRYSRFEPDKGWSTPDVMPGALPRPRAEPAAVELRMDAAGNVLAEWPSGFDPHETQVARYTPAQGWTRAMGATAASAPRASPAPLPPPSAR